MKIYLAGPMRGLHLYNFPAFFAASLRLRDAGHDVMNPAENDMACGINPAEPVDSEQNKKVFTMYDAFRWDFNAVYKADAVVLLPGWRKSTGVSAELTLAAYMGTKMFEYGEDLHLTPISVGLPTIKFDYMED